MIKKKLLSVCCGLAIAGYGSGAAAMSLVAEEGRTMDLNIEAMGAVFNSGETYDGTGDTGRGWQEWYVKAGLAGTNAMESGGLYWGVSLLANATTGDGDAIGFTNGEETKIDLEDAFVGWKSKDEKFDISIGRQQFVLGDGFIIANDAVNVGEPLEDAGLIDDHRGGTYWLASRKSFGNTVVFRYNADPLKVEAFSLMSNNDFQGNTEVAGLNVEWTGGQGTLGASYVTVTDVDDDQLGGLWSYRDGMNILNLRANGNLGVENLELAFGYAKESGGDIPGGDVDADAWYLQGAYTLADTQWSPKLTYRYSTFSGDDPATPDLEAFDPLFYGWTTGYGTWFQGEVAGNYAGPFNTNADIQMFNVTVAPQENLSVGLSYFTFKQKEPSENYGSEINLYAEWAIQENLIFSPLIGLYTPDTVGEAVQGNDDTNTYVQAFLLFLY